MISLSEVENLYTLAFVGKKVFKMGGGARPISKKTLFSINGENSPGSCVIKMLFYEVRHFSPNFHFLYVKVCL